MRAACLRIAALLFLAFSCHQEHEADRFGLEITRDNHGMASAFVKLQEENLGVRDGRQGQCDEGER